MSTEIERKYLVDFFDGKLLHQKSTITSIEQTYLIATEGERRIRKRVSDNQTEFFYTEKFGSGISRIENENKISAEEYAELMKEADSSLHTIKKIRYTFSYENQVFELDIYEFCNTHATLEIELKTETQEIQLPPFVHIIREITEEKAFKNRKLAEKLQLPI